jgi:hypothetical protein
MANLAEACLHGFARLRTTVRNSMAKVRPGYLGVRPIRVVGTGEDSSLQREAPQTS